MPHTHDLHTHAYKPSILARLRTQPHLIQPNGQITREYQNKIFLYFWMTISFTFLFTIYVQQFSFSRYIRESIHIQAAFSVSTSIHQKFTVSCPYNILSTKIYVQIGSLATLVKRRWPRPLQTSGQDNIHMEGAEFCNSPQRFISDLFIKNMMEYFPFTPHLTE